jgi:hypothetical protein
MLLDFDRELTVNIIYVNVSFYADVLSWLLLSRVRNALQKLIDIVDFFPEFFRL